MTTTPAPPSDAEAKRPGRAKLIALSVIVALLCLVSVVIGIDTNNRWLVGVPVALIAGGLAAGLVMLSECLSAVVGRPQVSSERLREAYRAFEDVVNETAERCITEKNRSEAESQLADFRLNQTRQLMLTEAQWFANDLPEKAGRKPLGDIESQSNELLGALRRRDLDAVPAHAAKLDKAVRDLTFMAGRPPTRAGR